MSIGNFANVKMLRNISAMIPTKIAIPQTLCVTTRSSLSLIVSSGPPASIVTARWMAPTAPYRPSMAALRQSIPAFSSRCRPASTACRIASGCRDGLPVAILSSHKSSSASARDSGAGWPAVPPNILASASISFTKAGGAPQKKHGATRGVPVRTVWMIFSRKAGRPSPVLATMGTTAAPSAWPRWSASMRWPIFSATSTMFNATITG